MELPHSATMYHVAEADFIQHLEIIKNSSRRVLTVSAWLETRPENSLVLTFDDGWAGIKELAMNHLAAMGYQATIFVTRDFIGRPRFLSEKDLFELAQVGCELGVHGTTHRMLSTCTSREILWEFASCKEYLEFLIGRPVISAALPGGDLSQRIIAAAQEAGLEAICTSVPGVNHNRSSPFHLKRIAVKQSTQPEDIQRYMQARLLPEIVRWMIFQLPRKMVGSRNYALLRRRLLGETKDGSNYFFDP